MLVTFNVYKTFIRRRQHHIDVETTSCVYCIVYWVSPNYFMLFPKIGRSQSVILLKLRKELLKRCPAEKLYLQISQSTHKNTYHTDNGDLSSPAISLNFFEYFRKKFSQIISRRLPQKFQQKSFLTWYKSGK